MLLVALLALAADPTPGPIKSFGDWMVACDNVHACEMTSLLPGENPFPGEDDSHDAISLSIVRGPGPAAGFDVELQFSVPNAGASRLIVDGVEVARGTPRNDLIRFTGANAARIVAALVKGRDFSVADSEVSVMGQVSLAGSSAALRFIDAEQGRAGTVTAAVAKGAKPATAVPMAAALPVLHTIKPSGKPVPITPALKRAMIKASECSEEYDGKLPDVEAYALGGGQTLALLPCGAGAYNYLTIPFVVTGGKPVIAAFDYPPGMTEKEANVPMLVNASWGEGSGQLSSYSKGRGIGDCGSAEDYVWDGTRFRLAEARRMDECRGSVNWLTVWRAKATQ